MKKIFVNMFFAVGVAISFSCGNADGIEDDYKTVVFS